jgi:hypothetical protein
MWSLSRSPPFEWRQPMERPNGLELSCPAEAGRLAIYSRACQRARHPTLWPSPPGQPQVLAFVQGFSELLGRLCEKAGFRKETG